MANGIKKKITEWREYILLLLAVCQVLGLIGAAYLANSLSPLKQDIAILQTEVKANNEDHDRLVQKDAFDVVVERINHISSRVDSIYSIITK